ncbi:universal stress protein [Roseobacter ponti]|uniref:Universal stress protein n=1 Tax=Roseobacter ponti TaxID=1891787 RepID=A0A858SR69_9RHOB|nr:universal stress protein [Roseobacter ponti]QJF51165.1 universal stress protein [Roseobacter ponti]
MTIRTIHVCLTTSRHAETLLKFAVPLARAHNAHLVGLHTIEALVVYPGIAMHIPDQAFGAFNESQIKEAGAIETIFRTSCQNADFQSEWRLLRAQSVSAADRLVESARAADLIIMSHDDKATDRYDHRHVQERVIRECGRPVIVVPLEYKGPPAGNHIMLGWSDTREAARAAHDLIPLAREGAQVDVVHIGPELLDELSDHSALDLAGMFARHGLSAEITRRDGHGRDVATLLGQIALEKGADLIATGAFGHSRIHDFVVGSVTLSLLRDAPLPVLFSG